MIEIKDLSFSYEKVLFKKLNFKLAPSEKIAITGPSGEGKSTLAQIICGHLKPNNGSIWLNKKNITYKPNKKIILVDQEDDLFPWLTVWKQVYNFSKNKNLTNEILDIVELNQCINLYPTELSGGMKKRLSIARAIALNPQLIVFDESFSSLDHDLRKRVLNNYSSFTEPKNIATIFISHNLDLIDEHLTGAIKLSDHR